MFFTYLIVPEGGHAGQALVRGSLCTSDIETAMRHAQAGFAPGVGGKARVGGNPAG